jgi:GNAT superfamily N-acetyltransferase
MADGYGLDEPGRPEGLMGSAAPPAAVLRRARSEDAGEVADVWLASFRAALPTVRLAHTDDEVRDWIARVVVGQLETWVADAGGEIVGITALHDDWIEQLYLRPDWRGRGVGQQFVGLAKERSPDGLQLWCFQVNAPARRFYERNGFVPAELTDGSGNEEREPDIRFEWGRPLRRDSPV